MNFIGFNKDKNLKDSCIEGMRQLIKNGKLNQEIAWDVQSYAAAVGAPIPLSEFLRQVFKSLASINEAQDWAIKHLEAIPVGADLSNIWPDFIKWLITDEKSGIYLLIPQKQLKDLFNDLINLDLVSGDKQLSKIIALSEQYMAQLNIENDPTNRQLYGLAIVRSIARGHSASLFENLRGFFDALNKDPLKEKENFETVNHDDLDDYLAEFTGNHPNKAENIINERFNDLVSRIGERLINLFKSAPVPNS